MIAFAWCFLTLGSHADLWASFFECFQSSVSLTVLHSHRYPPGLLATPFFLLTIHFLKQGLFPSLAASLRF
jgi:hypothetical protein